MDDHRVHRVSEALKEELSEIVGFEMDDPRLLAVAVTDVLLSPDGKHAHIRFATSGNDEKELAKAQAALDHARNYLRRELARRLNLRRVPELHFTADRWAEAVDRVEFLLKRAKKKRGPIENQP